MLSRCLAMPFGWIVEVKHYRQRRAVTLLAAAAMSMYDIILIRWTCVMAKLTGETEKRQGKTQGSRKSAGASNTGWFVKRSGASGQLVAVNETRVDAVMAAADRSGLLHEKSSRIGGRISPALVRQAKAQTGIETDTDLIEFALANVALEDKFAESFRAVRGTVDPDIKLGF